MCGDGTALDNIYRAGIYKAIYQGFAGSEAGKRCLLARLRGHAIGQVKVPPDPTKRRDGSGV